MKRWHTFLILAGLLVAYIFIINAVAGILASSGGFASGNASSEGDAGFEVNLGVSDSVSVSVVRQRFYGKIYEFVGKDKVSYVYLFNFLKLPLISGGVNFVYFHIVMVILLFVLLAVFSAMEK